jgi:hypothetical protein
MAVVQQRGALSLLSTIVHPLIIDPSLWYPGILEGVYLVFPKGKASDNSGGSSKELSNTLFSVLPLPLSSLSHPSVSEETQELLIGRFASGLVDLWQQPSSPELISVDMR